MAVRQYGGTGPAAPGRTHAGQQGWTMLRSLPQPPSSSHCSLLGKGMAMVLRTTAHACLQPPPLPSPLVRRPPTRPSLPPCPHCHVPKLPCPYGLPALYVHALYVVADSCMAIEPIRASMHVLPCPFVLPVRAGGVRGRGLVHGHGAQGADGGDAAGRAGGHVVQLLVGESWLTGSCAHGAGLGLGLHPRLRGRAGGPLQPAVPSRRWCVCVRMWRGWGGGGQEGRWWRHPCIFGHARHREVELLAHVAAVVARAPPPTPVPSSPP